MRFVLIGGKVNKEILDDKIERDIIDIIGVDMPKILFCPLAAINTLKSIKRFKEMMKNIKCEIDILDYNNIDKFDELLSNVDIFYVGGGNANHLVEVFKDNNLDKILINHLNDNITYVGSSAGAMLLTCRSFGDRDMYQDNFHNYNYKMVDCLDILHLSICPHFQNDDLIIYNDEVKKMNLACFGIEEGAALVIEDNRFYILKDNNKNMVYYYPKKDKKMIPLLKGIMYEEDSCFRS